MSDRSDRTPLDDLTSDALDQLYDERDRYRTAWRSARSRVKRAKRSRDGELRWANGMWSDALRDLDRYRKAWTSARHRAAMYLQSNRNFVAALDQPTTTASTGTSTRCCGRPDPGPCAPCPTGTPSLHCACTCTPTDATTKETA